MQLIYRGHIYDYTAPTSHPYYKPRAINWRYQTPGETYGSDYSMPSYQAPRCLNWQYQVAGSERH